MRFVPGNAQHIGSRQEQQDAFGFSDPEDLAFTSHGGFLAVLADGAGGMAHGGAASRVAVQTFLDAYRTKRISEDIAQALKHALLRANEAVLALAVETATPENIATTLVAVVLRETELHWISVGDSALYLFHDNSLSQLTVSHVYAMELERQVALGRISQSAALNHPDRDALTSYVGKLDLREIDQSLGPISLCPGDRVILASDGLFKTLTATEITSHMTAGAPQAVCEALVEETLAKSEPCQDNVTVLCIEAENHERSLGQHAVARHKSVWRIAALMLVACALAVIFFWWYRYG